MAARSGGQGVTVLLALALLVIAAVLAWMTVSGRLLTPRPLAMNLRLPPTPDLPAPTPMPNPQPTPIPRPD